MPTPIQVAFQGGGAKLSGLLAVGETLQEMQAAGRIQLARTAGTSAGSIVAAMLAARVDIAAEVRRLREGEGRHIARLLDWPGWRVALTRLWRHQPIGNPLGLRRWLERQFVTERQLDTIDSVRARTGIELKIARSNLSTRLSDTVADNTHVVEAILDSCAIPLYLRLWPREDGSECIVDGGLANNLPTPMLAQDNEIKRIAVSFKRRKLPTPRNLKDFLGAVIDVALAASEDQARALLPPEALFEIDTQMSTFSFSDALERGLDEEYRRVKTQAERWLESYLAQVERPRRAVPVNYWRDQNASAVFVMEQAAHVYNAVERKIPIEFLHCHFGVEVNCLRRTTDPQAQEPDRVRVALRFRAIDQPIRALCLTLLSNTRDPEFLRSVPDIDLRDAQDQPIETILMPARFDDEPDGSRQILVHPARPLEVGAGPFRMSYHESVQGFMRALVENGRDDLIFAPARGQGRIGRMELVLHVPVEVAASTHLVQREVQPLGRRMQAAELPANRDGLTAIGWVGADVPVEAIREQGWGVDIIRRP